MCATYQCQWNNSKIKGFNNYHNNKTFNKASTAAGYLFCLFLKNSNLCYFVICIYFVNCRCLAFNSSSIKRWSKQICNREEKKMRIEKKTIKKRWPITEHEVIKREIERDRIGFLFLFFGFKIIRSLNHTQIQTTNNQGFWVFEGVTWVMFVRLFVYTSKSCNRGGSSSARAANQKIKYMYIIV